MLVNAPAAAAAALPGGLRGDYAAARPDFTVAQDMAAYSEADHETWRTLHRRQAAILRDRAASAYLDGLNRLPFRDGVPDFAAAASVFAFGASSASSSARASRSAKMPSRFLPAVSAARAAATPSASSAAISSFALSMVWSSSLVILSWLTSGPSAVRCSAVRALCT